MAEYSKYIPLIIIALMTLLQIYIRFSSRRAKGTDVAWLSSYIDPVKLEQPRLLLYFSSEYCQPCKTLAPQIALLIEKGGNIVKLDSITDGELATKLGARGAPAFVDIRNGIVHQVHLGALSPAKLESICFE
jgi:thiol-disulfide isomerase/thioredoxin